LKILQYSQFNTVNVPFNYSNVYKKYGHDSKLLTLYKHRGNIQEDICLNKKIFDPYLLHKIRAIKQKKHIQTINATNSTVIYKPNNIFELAYFKFKDFFASIEFNKLSPKYNLNDFDIYHFHGGVGFFKDSRWIKKLKKMNKFIICNYHGPDIRIRGLIKEVDECSNLDITNEFDLIKLHSSLKYIPIPFDCSNIPLKTVKNKTLRILHTPSNLKVKGTNLIEETLKKIAKERNIEFSILTNKKQSEIIEAKLKSDIAVEQIGNFGGTGYGVNSLETLSMNIPTITEFTPDYEEFLKEHPFVLANKETLYYKLLKLIDNEKYRLDIGNSGRNWVIKNHSYEKVWNILTNYIKEVNENLYKCLIKN